MPGTTLETTVGRVVDGDTLVVPIEGADEYLRLLSLDTEESKPSSSKPVTPLGQEATAEANRFWDEGDPVILEFPGTESLRTCLKKYRGNFKRLLVWAYRPDNTDYQEHMIKAGLSPYFVKYGYAKLAANHDRYTAAEREAQTARRGVWDQLTGNGREINNYAALTTWWTLRAKVINEYREHLATNPANPVLNTRLDYDELLKAAQQERELSIFTEVRNVDTADGHAVIDIGSIKRRFCVFIPNAYTSPSRVRVLNLLNLRYIAGDLAHPRRGYVYLQGRLDTYRGTPQIRIESTSQISDSPP